jgi:serine/threonine protein kinase
MILEEYCE